ncbi:MAG: MMPL family transporter [Pirellulales bacterium]
MNWYGRCAPFILTVFAVVAPLLFYGAYRAVRNNVNRVADWLPESYAETADLQWFRQHFVTDQFIIISWDGCRLGGDPDLPGIETDDPRIERLAQYLSISGGQDENLARKYSSEEFHTEANYFESITTGRQLLDQLTAPPMGVPYEIAVDRLTGTFVGPDGRQTCIVATVSQEATARSGKVLGRRNGLWRNGEGELFRALRACNIEPETAHLGGPVVDNVAIDEEGERTLVRLAALSGVVGLTLAWVTLRSMRLTLIVFSCGILSAAASLAAVWLTGSTTDAVLMSMPPLVYVLAISGAVHLINYYRDAIEEQGFAGAVERAMAHGWKPALLCSVTTALGLISLYVSELAPIRKFGIYSALGVMIILVVLFAFLPSALCIWPVTRFRRRSIVETTSPQSHFWDAVGTWVIRNKLWVTLACSLTIVGAGFGIQRIRTNIDLLKLFDDNARVIHDYQWLEAHVGRLVPLEVVLRFDEQTIHPPNALASGNTYSLIERMEVVNDVQSSLVSRFGIDGQDIIGPPMSAVTFVPPLPDRRRSISQGIRRSVTNSNLERSVEALRGSGFLRIDPQSGAELWRISVRVAAFEDVDYGQFASQLRQIVEPVLDKHNHVFLQRVKIASRPEPVTENRTGITAVYTGVVPIVYKAQRELLTSLIESTFWSFTTITPVLMLISRGVLSGLVSMLPNVFPVVLIFGSMGWIGIPVDIGSMMSASIALGVAVDDTIHYLSWFRQDLQYSGDRQSAILSAYGRCATPTLQAALINGVGLFVFALSTFTPTKKFGMLMLAVLFAGVVAELVLLPAVLAGPLGRVFRIQPQNLPAPPEPSPEFVSQ